MLAKTIAMLDAALAKPAPKPRKKAAKKAKKAPRKKAAKKAKKAPRKKAAKKAKKAPRKKVAKKAKKAPRKKAAKKAKKAPRKKVAKKAKKAPRKKAAKKAAKRQPSTDVVLLRVEDAAAELHGHPKPSKTRAATLRRLITGGRKALAGRDHYSRAEVADAINGAIEAGKRRR
jgi:hypothetical protein